MNSGMPQEMVARDSPEFMTSFTASLLVFSVTVETNGLGVGDHDHVVDLDLFKFSGCRGGTVFNYPSLPSRVIISGNLV